MKTLRSSWNDFPDVVIHANESVVKKHPDYIAAKSGNASAANNLVLETFSQDKVEYMRQTFSGLSPILISAHAYENEGVNAIPEVFATQLAKQLSWGIEGDVVQTNVVTHTGAGGAVVAAVTLTGKAHSSVLAPRIGQIELLRSKHGPELENWWFQRFNHTIDTLTESEARYLINTADFDTIRNRIIAAEQAGDRESS